MRAHLPSRRQVLALAVGIVIIGSVVGGVVAFSNASTQSYYGSFVVASGLLQPEVLGFNSGSLFFATYSGSQVGSLYTSVSLEALNTTSLTTEQVATLSNAEGVSVTPGLASFDGSGTLFYVVGFGNGTEAVFSQSPTPSGFSSPALLYRDAPCGLVAPPTKCSPGIWSLASDASGDVYIGEWFTPLSSPAGNGSSMMKEVPAGTSEALTLLHLNAAAGAYVGIGQLFPVTGGVIFSYSNSTLGTSLVDLLTLPSASLTTLATFPNTQDKGGLSYIALGPSAGRHRAPLLYYVYRESRGPTNFDGSPSGFPAAEFIVGAISTTSPTLSRHGALPGLLGSDFFPPPVSVAVFTGQNNLQVSSQGNLVFIVAPYTFNGLGPSGAYVLQLFSGSNSQSSQIISEDVGQSAGQGTYPSFTMDGAGNLFYASTTGTIIEVLA